MPQARHHFAPIEESVISRAALVAWILALPYVHDGNGHDIPRPNGFADVIATVALEHSELDARILAATLDVIAAHESAYRVRPRGYNDGGASKGAWQTPSRETPDDPIGQARVAAKWLITSISRCPEHPISLYATGHVCGAVRVADYYWLQIKTELAIPIVEQ
jgi:hypothetical protein